MYPHSVSLCFGSLLSSSHSGIQAPSLGSLGVVMETGRQARPGMAGWNWGRWAGRLGWRGGIRLSWLLASSGVKTKCELLYPVSPSAPQGEKKFVSALEPDAGIGHRGQSRLGNRTLG